LWPPPLHRLINLASCTTAAIVALISYHHPKSRQSPYFQQWRNRGCFSKFARSGRDL
jgi:hypothetical protein